MELVAYPHDCLPNASRARTPGLLERSSWKRRMPRPEWIDSSKVNLLLASLVHVDALAMSPSGRSIPLSALAFNPTYNVTCTDLHLSSRHINCNTHQFSISRPILGYLKRTCRSRCSHVDERSKKQRHVLYAILVHTFAILLLVLLSSYIFSSQTLSRGAIMCASIAKAPTAGAKRCNPRIA